MEKNLTILLCGSGENCPEIRYASGFNAPDDFIYGEKVGRKICMVSPLEFNRASSQVKAGVEVMRTEKPELESIQVLLKELGSEGVVVPRSFPVGLADELRKAGFQIEAAESVLYPEREFKSDEEGEKVRTSLRAAEAGCRRAFQVLKESSIASSGEIIWQGTPLTSEILRAEIDCTMLKMGMLPTGTICAGNLQGSQPHNPGSGVLTANYPIVMDIFPRSAENGYWGDLTRTVVKGKASDTVRRAYDAVFEAREFARSMIRIGASKAELHRCAANVLEKHGFATGHDARGDFGFFHSLGHGVGLEIHESPRLSSKASGVLQGGEIVTVEPGLYYPEWGGIRLEDMVFLHKDGRAEKLTEIEDFLEIR